MALLIAAQPVAGHLSSSPPPPHPVSSYTHGCKRNHVIQMRARVEALYPYPLAATGAGTEGVPREGDPKQRRHSMKASSRQGHSDAGGVRRTPPHHRCSLSLPPPPPSAQMDAASREAILEERKKTKENKEERERERETTRRSGVRENRHRRTPRRLRHAVPRCAMWAWRDVYAYSSRFSSRLLSSCGSRCYPLASPSPPHRIVSP